jgi:hypothetical protein
MIRREAARSCIETIGCDAGPFAAKMLRMSQPHGMDSNSHWSGAMHLTKSDYTHHYLQCPIHLWVWKHRRDEVAHQAADPQFIWILEEGNEVERIARLRFPDGCLIEEHGDDAAVRTREHIAAGATTLFQATATGDRLLAMADILQLDPATKRWDLFEVKSSTKPKGEHVHDLCFQRMSFRNAGFEIGKLHLVYVNGGFIRNGKIDPAAFLVVEDLTQKVDEIETTVASNVAKALSVIDQEAVPTRDVLACTCTPKECPCGQFCYPGLPPNSVFDLYNIRGKKARELYDHGIRVFGDIPKDFTLTQPQANQVHVAQSGEPIIDRAGIRDALQKLSYPLYFLDYETFSPAIPLFDGYKPYQQMVFQYSLHIMPSPDASPEHREYLAEELRDPLHDVTTRLRQDIGDEGTVVVWNKTFEIGRNREMAERAPAHAAFLHAVNDRVFDLMDIFRDRLFVHPDCRGSNSIKDVLPVLVPELSYDELEIKEGSTASLTWYRMLTDGRAAKALAKTCDDLRTYCTLDTRAMVEIFRYLSAL